MLLDNYVLSSVLISAVLSQGIKIINKIKMERRSLHLTDLILTGGMPSTHSSLASSLFASLIFSKGFNELTVISLVLFIIVITDSMGVRRSVGEEGKVLNKIIKIENLKIHELHLSLGHKPIEVLAGIIIGFAVPILLWLIIFL